MTNVKVQASYFSSVLGLAGLGAAWRASHGVWGMPTIVGEGIMLIASIVWAVLLGLYLAKWIFNRPAALDELKHPIQGCFGGLPGVATLLIALAGLPYAPAIAQILFVLGSAYTIGFAVWLTGRLWRGERAAGAITPALYLPGVAGSFVTATAASAFGYSEFAQFSLGAGLLSWLAIESVVLHRLYTVEPLPFALRPTLGIQLAPPVVGLTAYLSVSGGRPDIVAYALIGYGLFQGLVLLRELPWILRQPFAATYWGFTFGVTALGAAPIRLMQHGEHGLVAALAIPLFIGANGVMALIAGATALRYVQSQIYPSRRSLDVPLARAAVRGGDG